MTRFSHERILLSPLALLSMDEYRLRPEDILATITTPDTTTKEELGYLTVEKSFARRTICLSYFVASSPRSKHTYAVVYEIICTAPLPF
jgi:hypothetical protein